jgi:hypothetical protein
MSTIDDFLKDLSTAIGSRNISYNSSSAACDIYEGYAFGLVLRAAIASWWRRRVQGSVRQGGWESPVPD